MGLTRRGVLGLPNGQTVNNAIVLDNSKYLNRPLSIDEENMRCTVKPVWCLMS